MKWFLLFCILTIGFCPDTNAQQNISAFLIPQPTYLKTMNFAFNFENGTSLIYPKNKGHQEIINVFASQLTQVLKKKVSVSGVTKRNSIRFILSNTAKGLGKEGYQLEILRDKILITAQEPNGWFYGWQSLIQLLRLNLQSNHSLKIEGLIIKDQPKFEWRGLMIDVSRHFFSKEVLKRYIDQMAKYKFNVLHLHLTDNQGWRIEIKQLPKLTNVGAWRVPRTGSWKEMPAPEKDEEPTYGGFYSQDDIKEIIEFANSKFVDVVPEIDLPGHSLAFIAAYPEVSCTKTPQKVLAGDAWNPTRTNVLCAGNDSVYFKIDQIIGEIATIFPSKYIHIGGDEVSRTYWSNCSTCQNRIKTEGLKDVNALQSYFINRVAKIVKSKGKTAIGWYENLTDDLDKDIVQMSWKDEKGAIKSSNENKKVILTPAFFTYLDFYQGDPFLENMPFTVNRLSNTYKFNPLPSGIKYENVLGGQGSLWTEQVPNERKLQFMTWPRSLVLADKLWANSKTSWPYFAEKIEKQLPLFQQDTTNYSRYFYDPIATAVKGANGETKIKLETEWPDLKIYYAFDDTDPDYFYPSYRSEPLTIPKGAKNIRLVSYRNTECKSRIIRLPISELKKRAKL